MKEYIERILQARNALNALSVTGVNNTRVLTTIYDYLTETAEMMKSEEQPSAEE